MKYIGYLIAVFIVSGLIFGLYEDYNKSQKSAKSTRIECHKEVTVFEKVYKKESIQEIQKVINSGNYKLISSVKKSKFAKSKLFETVKLHEVDKLVTKELEKYHNNEKKGKKINIVYYIYENDVDDPGKKTAKSKLYAGYLNFEFKDLNNELIYQIQIDFMDKKGQDLPNRINCAIKSFMTIGKKQ